MLSLAEAKEDQVSRAEAPLRARTVKSTRASPGPPRVPDTGGSVATTEPSEPGPPGRRERLPSGHRPLCASTRLGHAVHGTSEETGLSKQGPAAKGARLRRSGSSHTAGPAAAQPGLNGTRTSRTRAKSGSAGRRVIGTRPPHLLPRAWAGLTLGCPGGWLPWKPRGCWAGSWSTCLAG